MSRELTSHKVIVSLFIACFLSGCSHPQAVGSPSQAWVITKYESRSAESGQDAAGNVTRQPEELAGRDFLSHQPDQLMIDHQLALTELAGLKDERDKLQQRVIELEEASAVALAELIELRHQGKAESPMPAETIVSPETLLPLVVMYGPPWCGVCGSNDKAILAAKDKRFRYRKESDENTFPDFVKAFADKHGYPVFHLNGKHGPWLRSGYATPDQIMKLYERPAAEPAKVNAPSLGNPVALDEVEFAGLRVKAWYESVHGETSQPTDEHLLYHGFTAQQITAMRYEDRCFWHGLAHQLTGK